ncbi:MAG: hypothetical protein V4717_06120 [Bacteroidota bacterium]
MKVKILSAILFTLLSLQLSAQKITSRKKFFVADEPVIATLKTNFYKLSTNKKDSTFQPATLTWHNADTTGDVSEQIGVKLRGYYRKDFCSFAALTFNFKDSTKKSKLKNFKQLKIVVPCEWGTEDEQYLLKEYMVYKIYQLFTDLSFRVRLMQFRFEDNSGKIKPYKQYGFAIEPVDDLAKRNNCKEQSNRKVLSEQTNRLHTTFVSIFEYMIGNSDWAIPPHHNIKIVAPKDSLTVPPYIVPFDFDFSGAVNAIYATPPLNSDLTKVTERKYMGFKRSLEEVRPIVAGFLEKEQSVYKLINDFTLFKPETKKEMTAFLESFFNEIRDEKKVQKIFVDGARVSK